MPGGEGTTVRCAIYTRKSTEEGLTQEFNSLDAQRECCQAYIQSQRQQGWSALPQHYDDGGYSGSTLNRPGVQQLLADIAGGCIDTVVIYKVDRLSRSLFDFARVMQLFDKHGVSFVSVTQQLNSSTPMGRLTLHVLLSFAQFEKEIISERTRDKISAARRKGKWMGGYPVLGYDADPSGTRLVVNEPEAEQVREIFAMFVRHGAVLAVLEEIGERGWRMKSWTTRENTIHAGGAFDRPGLVRLLTNVLYTGKVKHRGQVYAGEQPAIIEAQVWNEVSDLLGKRHCGSEKKARNRQGALLKGLLECAVCGSRMVPGYTRKKGRQYPYYVCLKAQKGGSQACRGQSVTSQRIEPAVVQGVQELSGQSGREALREALTLNWEGLERAAQHGILTEVIDRISYDGRNAGASLYWAGEPESAPTAIRIPGKVCAEPPAPAVEQKPSVACVAERLPRITRLMALAVRFEGLLRDGRIRNCAELARLGGVSRARITQILNLRNLAPSIQEEILLVGPGSRVKNLPERAIRRLMGNMDWRRQTLLFEKLVQHGGPIESTRGVCATRGRNGEKPATDGDRTGRRGESGRFSG